MVRRLFFLILSFFAISVSSQHQHFNFIKGEQISYEVNYGLLNVGEVVFAIDSSIAMVDSLLCIKATIVAKTKGVAGFFSKIQDEWTSFIDSTSSLSHKFSRLQFENNYKLVETTEFDRGNNQALVTRLKENNAFELKVYPIASNAQDLVSAFLQIRNLEGGANFLSSQKINPVFLEDTTYNFQFNYLGKDRLRTKIGKYKTVVYSPIIPKTKNSILVEENAIKLWISDDNKHIPLKIKINSKYGAVEVDIATYSGYKD